MGINKQNIAYQKCDIGRGAHDCRSISARTIIGLFNYSSDDRTIILYEIDAGLQQCVRLPRSLCHHNAQIRTLHIVRNVFAVTEGIEPRS